MTRFTANRVRKDIIPGYRISMAVTVTMLLAFIIIPLASVFVSVLSIDFNSFIDIIFSEQVLWALGTSIGFSFLAAMINAVFGVMLAWVIVRYDFPGKRILDGLIELPFAIPTAVAGITLSKLYSTTGEIGGPLSHLGIKVSYTRLGLLVALVFIGIPFVVRSVIPVLEKFNAAYEEAAYILGAGRLAVFRTVVLPELTPAILMGFGLAFARGIGEYGSLVYISGNSAKNHTQVISYVIMQKLNYMDYDSAAAIAFVLLVICFVIIFIINSIATWQASRTGGLYENVTACKSVPIRKIGMWGGVLLAICVLYVIIMLLVPLISIVINSLSKGHGFYMESISTEYVISAMSVTLLATALALVATTVFGLFASWLLTRFTFRGSQILVTLIDIPFSVSPVIAGLSFIMMFGRKGWAYPILEVLNEALGVNIKIVFALPGVVLATIFVTIPFVAREVIPVMNSVGKDEEEAAAITGDNGFSIFKNITFPHIRWALVYGVILCMSRALGEFGAVNALSKTRGKTFTLPLEIDALYMAGTADSIVSAFAVSSVLVLIAVCVLVLREVISRKYK